MPNSKQPEALEQSGLQSPHSLEENLQRQLHADPRLQFSSLVIHRIPDGICLEGFLETSDECPDICQLVRSITGIEQVLNHLVVRQPDSTPPKG